MFSAVDELAVARTQLRTVQSLHRFTIDDLERDDFSSSRHPALAFCLSIIFSENRIPPRIKSRARFFRIVL
jgi:hypothetical protein